MLADHEALHFIRDRTGRWKYPELGQHFAGIASDQAESAEQTRKMPRPPHYR
jgi:hypothetical protein